MDLLELLLDLVLEGTMELSQSPKISKRLRWGLVLLLAVFFAGGGLLLLLAAGNAEGPARRWATRAIGLGMAAFAAGLVAAAWKRR